MAAEFSLYHIAEGGGIPQHNHSGTETTLVLQGGFSDESVHTTPEILLLVKRVKSIHQRRSLVEVTLSPALSPTALYALAPPFSACFSCERVSTKTADCVVSFRGYGA